MNFLSSSIYHWLLTVLLIFSAASGYTQFQGVEISGGGRITSLDVNNLRLNQLTTIGEGNQLGGNVFSKLHYNLGNRWLKLSPEVFFIQNGTQETHQNLSTVGQNLQDRKIRLNYAGLSLPLSIFLPLSKKDQKKQSGIEIYGSGFVDYAVGGSFEDANGISQDLQFGDSTSDKMDLGISTGIGLMLNGLVVRVGYDRGLKEIAFIAPEINGQNTLYNTQNTGFYGTIGFMKSL